MLVTKLWTDSLMESIKKESPLLSSLKGTMKTDSQDILNTIQNLPVKLSPSQASWLLENEASNLCHIKATKSSTGYILRTSPLGNPGKYLARTFVLKQNLLQSEAQSSGTPTNSIPVVSTSTE